MESPGGNRHRGQARGWGEELPKVKQNARSEQGQGQTLNLVSVGQPYAYHPPFSGNPGST